MSGPWLRVLFAGILLFAALTVYFAGPELWGIDINATPTPTARPYPLYGFGEGGRE